MTYISPRNKVLANIDRVVDWRRGGTPAPVTVEWDLSNRCVLGCQDCHFAHTHSRGPWASSTRALPMAFSGTGDLANRVVVRRALFDMQLAGVKGVIWSGGGEPTTHPDWLDIAHEAHGFGLEQGMYTLGGLLTESTALAFKRIASWVVVSLDCPDAKAYAAEKRVPEDRFRAACNGLRMLTGGSATVGASFLIHGKNWKRIGEMWKLAQSLGATYTTFRPAIQTSPDAPGVPLTDRKWVDAALSSLLWWSKQAGVELDVERFEAYRDWQGHGYDACRGIQLSTTVTPDGRVWVCPQRRGIEGSCLGDLSRESFAEIWARHPRQWTDFEQCRVMCRMHLTNQVMAGLAQPQMHEAFV